MVIVHKYGIYHHEVCSILGCLRLVHSCFCFCLCLVHEVVRYVCQPFGRFGSTLGLCECVKTSLYYYIIICVFVFIIQFIFIYVYVYDALLYLYNLCYTYQLLKYIIILYKINNITKQIINNLSVLQIKQNNVKQFIKNYHKTSTNYIQFNQLISYIYILNIYKLDFLNNLCIIKIIHTYYKHNNQHTNRYQSQYQQQQQQQQMKANQQNLLDYDDMFASLTPDILKNIFIRFYTMQDYFQFPNKPAPPISTIPTIQTNQQNIPQAIQSLVTPVNMLFNRTIQQSICDLYIMNKLINAKAKLVVTIFDNGRSIAQKKNDSWKQFIKQPGFQKVNTAYNLLPQFKKDIVKFAVLSISNLLLKLAINMSKISVICLQKFINFQCLSIPTLSVVFLQNLQYRLFKSKGFTNDQQNLNFMRQLPKVTFIKLNKYKSNTDLQLLQTSQDKFISSRVNQPVKNMQFIQIHQKSNDPFLPSYQRKTSYPFIYSIDLQKMTNGKVQAPFYFQILQIMRQIVFPLVKDFRPDLIVYMESYPNDIAVMNDQVRALMLCQMAEQTSCNKLYVFKELGIDKLQNKEYKTALLNAGSQKITEQFNKIMVTEQKKFGSIMNKKLLMNAEDKKWLNKIKKIFLDELCYTSLALIQKTSFDNIYQKSNKYFHIKELLQGIQKQQLELMIKYKTEQSLAGVLKIKLEGIKMMIEVLKFRKNQGNGTNQIINLINRQTYFKTIYNLHTDKIEPLIAQKGNKMVQYGYSEEDNLLIKYYENKLIVVIIKKIKQKNEQKILISIIQKINQQKTFKVVGQIVTDLIGNDIQGATYVFSKDYLYRGFGKFRYPVINQKTQEKNEGYNKMISRLQINPQIGKGWDPVGSEGFIVKVDGTQVPHGEFQKKIHGYGFYQSEGQLILMMGGYVDSFNEQRISKNIVWIKNPDSPKQNPKEAPKICILGKTNRIVYLLKQKQLFLYPFVFGIPFLTTNSASKSLTKSGKDAFILNSNGFYLNLNHNNKIFATNVKVFHYALYNGITSQNKLKISEDLEEAATSIFLSQLLIKCMVHFPQHINIKGDTCCIQTLEEGPIIMTANGGDKTISIKAPQIFQDSQWRKIKFI